MHMYGSYCIFYRSKYANYWSGQHDAHKVLARETIQNKPCMVYQTGYDTVNPTGVQQKKLIQRGCTEVIPGNPTGSGVIPGTPTGVWSGGSYIYSW